MSTNFEYKGHKVEIDRDFNKFHCNQISIDGRIVARPFMWKNWERDHSDYAKALIDDKDFQDEAWRKASGPEGLLQFKSEAK